MEALPLGNGKLGAMIFGGVEEGLIQLKVRYGVAGPVETNVNPEAKLYLSKIREALLQNHCCPVKEKQRQA